MAITYHNHSMVDSLRALGIHNTSNIKLELRGRQNSHSDRLLGNCGHHLFGRIGRNGLDASISESFLEGFALIVTSSVRVISRKRDTMFAGISHSSVWHSSSASVIIVMGAIHN